MTLTFTEWQERWSAATQRIISATQRLSVATGRITPDDDLSAELEGLRTVTASDAQAQSLAEREAVALFLERLADIVDPQPEPPAPEPEPEPEPEPPASEPEPEPEPLTTLIEPTPAAAEALADVGITVSTKRK